MTHELVPTDDVLDGDVLDGRECEQGYSRCTNTNVQLVEDLYESDVNNNPGQLIWACPECYEDICDDI